MLGEPMPISTRLTELLKVQHPILLAPMDVVADGKLAATVSKAGGFGIIGGGYGNEHWLDARARRGGRRARRRRLHHLEHGEEPAAARHCAGAQAAGDHAVVR